MYSEDFERPHGQERNAEDVYSKPVRAGKRTYFFDVKTTKLARYLLFCVNLLRKISLFISFFFVF